MRQPAQKTCLIVGSFVTALVVSCGGLEEDEWGGERFPSGGKADSVIEEAEVVVRLPARSKRTGGFLATPVGTPGVPVWHFKRAVKITSSSILAVRANPAKHLNTMVKVSGQFYGGSIPLVIDDVKRTETNAMLPPYSYVPLVGALPRLDSGDTITVRGRLVRPTAAMGAGVKYESAVLQVSSGGVQVTKASTWSAKGVGVTVAPTPVLQPMPVMPYKHAVLISGGVNGANNHARYWNDLAMMYKILLKKGYAAGNIHVLYAHGQPENNDMPVDGMATRANITAVFDALKLEVDADWRSSVFIMVNDHGGGFDTRPGKEGIHGGILDTNNDELDPPVSEAAVGIDINGDGDKKDTANYDEVLYLWGFDPSGRPNFISDDTFAVEVDKLSKASRITIVLEQCYGGGFLEDLTKMKHSALGVVPNRVLMSAASANQPSWANWGGAYNAFTHKLMCSFLGYNPGNVNWKFDADFDGDGKHSTAEVYELARQMDDHAMVEDPHYEDNGLVPPTSAPLTFPPPTSEGVLGSNTFL